MKNWKNSMRYGTLAVLLMLIAIMACGRKSMVRKYYLIEMPALADSARWYKEPPGTATCEIREVEVNPVFAGNDIALRRQSHEVTYYRYHQWAVKPAELVSTILVNYLENQGLFDKIQSRFWGETPDYSLQTHIKHLELIEEKKQLAAHLHIEFILFKNGSGQQVVSHQADRYVPLKKRNINLFAAEISSILMQEVRTLSERIAEKMMADQVAGNASGKQ